MLVLTRKSGESIIIGSDVEVMILEINGDHIRVGINTPRSVPIYRAELWAEIQKENALAASRQPGLQAVLDALPHAQQAPAGEAQRPPTVRIRAKPSQ